MISIIGSGKVGSAIAFLIASNSLDDIVLVNRTKSKAIGEALDIVNAIPQYSSISISGTDDFSKIKNSEIIVITASTGVYTKNRTEIISAQVKMIKEIAKKIMSYNTSAKILIISNPIDILTYVFQKETNFPWQNVIGIASSLDSSRLRYIIANQLKIKQSNITNAIVLGEHGDSMIPIFSVTKINNKPALEILSEIQIETMTKKVRNYWKTLREYKSRSVFGIAKNTYDVIESIIKDKEISIPASVLLNNQYEISDICLGIPVQIGKQGVKKILEINLTSLEQEALLKSSKIIKNNIHSEL